ncbi:MAG: methionyl-tRNA formyltransferase [Bacteroidetes bacterium]|nr:methionyl-tRNA formyltransferase [Bacteroidota bacterium]
MIFQQSIIFFGTPDFAVASIEALLQNQFNIKAVVTTPDKPSGRGKKITASPLKAFAVANTLNLLQPENLSDEEFLQSLQSLNADLFIVVAFRKLPSKVWQMPRLGTFNLHASLLPDYRGAAPINWAIMNGEKETGVTTFFLNENIDEGKIIFSKKVMINDDETYGELYDKLKSIGSTLIIKTVEAIFTDNVKPISQEILINNCKLNKAPKIHKQDCKIIWKNSCNDIVNKIRGLSPAPAAYTILISEDLTEYYIKIYKATANISSNNEFSGKIYTDNKTYLKISTPNGYVFLSEIQIAGKNRMTIADLLRGYPVNNNWKAL